jgi:cytochrome c oxidase assembly protein subunit 15
MHNIPFPQDRTLAGWLLVCCTLIFAMVILGGVTRLTGSGLSMVEWKPVTGLLPPLGQDAWESEFDKYRGSPEYRMINVGMDLDGFKNIYWLEYSHRLLGRSIGFAFLLPFLYFLARRRIASALTPRLLGLFLLGGLQGLMGWYMVKSGLVDNPHVSQYRLTAHLLLAFVIYGYMLWLALDLWYPRPSRPSQPAHERLRGPALGLTLWTLFTIASGGFVAGLKAGFAYNTFPLMDGHWIPRVMWLLDPWWHNLFENIATVQFNHRLLALLTLAGILAIWLAGRGAGLGARARLALHLLLAAGLLQVALGISTLLLHVPLSLAAAHQGGALLLFSALVFFNHALRRDS